MKNVCVREKAKMREINVWWEHAGEYPMCDKNCEAWPCTASWKHGTTPLKSNGQLLSRHCPINTCFVTAQEMPTTSTAAALSKSLPTILF